MAEEVREPTVEEKDRWVAEAEKFRAEAEFAKAQADRERAGVDYSSAMNQLVLDKQVRVEREELAGDKFHHIYYFTDPVSGASGRACMRQLASWRRQAGGLPLDLEICFSSPGGDVIEGLALFDYIQETRREGHTVTTSTIGYAASMAGILLQAGNKRVMGAEAWILIHEISFGAGGKIGEVEDTVSFVKRIQERVIDIFAARCKSAGDAGTASKPLTKAQLKKHWLRKDWWINSDEALKFGLVDEVR